jgi:hypothetical protein
VARQLRQEDTFGERFAELVPLEATREHILAGVQATLCKDPTVGVAVDTDCPDMCWYFFVPESEAWDTPTLTVIYVFDEEAVYLDWVD